MRDDDFEKLNNEAGFSKKNTKYIVFTALLLVYFIVILLLDSLGIISVLVRRIFMYGMFLVMLIVYAILRRREK